MNRDFPLYEDPITELLDGASSEGLETTPWQRNAADPFLPLDTRLEAFADIIDSEIGDTTLVRARNLERDVALRQLFLKFEGGNPTGTQKDRIAFDQVMDALRRGFDVITMATCGNYGAAIATAARLAGLACRIFIPEGYHPRRVAEMRDLGATIEHVNGDYETAVLASKACAAREELYDANPGGENTSLQLRAYGNIAAEIYDELRDAPAIVALPVSNGTTLAGVYRGFVSLYRRGKTSRIPKVVAGSTFRKNPIINSFIKNHERCQDLAPQQIRETRTNEPLINWHAIDGNLALGAVRSSGGWAGYASDRGMRQMARHLRDKLGLQVLPASTAGLISLLEAHQNTPFPGDRYVAVLTGRGE
jgi:threonine synthase